MQKKIIGAYFFIFVILIAMMSLSRHTSEAIRSGSVAAAAPLWEKLLSLKYFVSHPKDPSPFVKVLAPISCKEEKEQLLLENQLLKNEISLIKKNQAELVSLVSNMAEYAPHNGGGDHYALLIEQQRSFERLLETLYIRLQAVPARVILRSFDTWNQSLWINIGSKINEEIVAPGSPLIAINSPVVIGSAIVGVVDFVGAYQSRVRLLTNRKLHPSVCVVRGGEAEGFIGEKIQGVLEQMRTQKIPSLSKEEQMQLTLLLQKLKKNLDPLKKNIYFAKGELAGSLFPSTRNSQGLVRGTGFTQRFLLSEGLRCEPLLQENDILVTTGMDGVFPPGFQTVIINKIIEKKEGDYFYEIEGVPVAYPVEELSLVFVLPPIKKSDAVL